MESSDGDGAAAPTVTMATGHPPPQQQCGGGLARAERLCRLCGTITTHPNQRVDIFAVDGLPAMIETCLPVNVLKESLLPDTLCTTCNEKIHAFFKFRKRSLETLKILEENFHVARTCFKNNSATSFPIIEEQRATPSVVKETRDQSTMTDNLASELSQFDEWRSKKLATFHYDADSFSAKQENARKLQSCAQEMKRAEETLALVKREQSRDKLVQYDSSESESDDVKEDTSSLQMSVLAFRKKLYFDDKVNDLISEICERKSTKRKLDALFTDGGAEQPRAKIFKSSGGLHGLGGLFPDCQASSRRKKRPPAKRVPSSSLSVALPMKPTQPIVQQVAPPMNIKPVEQQLLPQVCLLCDQQFPKAQLLAKHVFETHGIDMAQVLSSEPIPEGMTRTLHANLQNLQLQHSLTLQPLPLSAVVVSGSSAAVPMVPLGPLVQQPPPVIGGCVSGAVIGMGEELMLGVESPRGGRSPKSGGSQSQCGSAEKKKKLPELVKITDLKTKRESIEKVPENDAPPTLTASYVCPLCPASLTNKTDLYAHLRVRHAQHAKLICGLCLHIATSLSTLQEHLDACTKSHAIQGYFVCQVCKYAEDNQKSLENHVLVHDFLLADCKKDGKIFDPSDYVDANDSCEPKCYSCTECGSSLQSFKEYSSHKRSEHSIFHCDLCNKSYGRNSHLWKHVNRVHKGHPSVTCQFCYKTSASKYHLLQHFNKIHTQKHSVSSGLMTSQATPISKKNGDVLSEFEEDDFMMKKFDPFDFQSVRQSFMRAELEAKRNQEDAPTKSVKIQQRATELRDLSSLKMPTVPPKELDSSSTIYTNIITNYTPPTNDGEYKCPKCAKAFHKRTLLKKHKKNCRPRLQKDLLTRCKSCSRIFKDRQSLAKHLVNYHSEYSCEMCAEKVQSKCEIVSHIRFTHPGCHLICQDCGNVLRNNDLLRAHLQDHANSFVCQFCGDILPSKIKLKMHILSLHRKILSLSCGVCLKLFESQHILRDHVRMVHREALQPLTSCTVCGKNYGSKWKTYDHLNKSHGRVFRACKVCLEVFNNEQELQAHVDAHHSKGMKKFMPDSGTLNAYDQVGLKKEEEDEVEEVDEESEEDEGIKDEYEGKSILEKHLVGAYRNNNSGKQNGLGTPKMQPMRHPEELINSSKRTVYVNSNDPSVCDICHKNWPAKKHLWQHYIRCHKQVAATVCGICLKTNKSYADLQRHLNTEHPTLLHGKGFGSNFICRICGRYHNASSKLKLHMAIHIKFDWSLLDNPSQSTIAIKQESSRQDYDDEPDDEEEVEVPQEKFKFKVKIKPLPKKPEGVNYESMIEQVECSTNSSSTSESEDEGEDDGEGEDGDEGEDADNVDGDEITGDNQDVEDVEDVDDEEDEDDEDLEEEEAEDEQNVSQEDDGEIELSEEDDDEDEDGDDGEDGEDGEPEEDEDDDMEEVQEVQVKSLPLEEVEAHLQRHHQSAQSEIRRHVTGDQELAELKQSEDNEEGDEPEDEEGEPEDEDEPEDAEDYEDHPEEEEQDDGDEVEDPEQDLEEAEDMGEYEHEYEEVVEEVVDDHITIYEQEEIIEDSYMESDVDGVEVDEQGQLVIKHHIIQEDDPDEESTISEEIHYEHEQVTYVQHVDDLDGTLQDELEGEETLEEDVDNAVQSICYEEDSLHDGQVAEEYEVQSTNAPPMNNQHEIQSAVDSIL